MITILFYFNEYFEKERFIHYSIKIDNEKQWKYLLSEILPAPLIIFNKKK